MQKIILITGSTDGIGLEAAKTLVSQGCHVLIHGRNPEKLDETKKMLSGLPDNGRVESYVADLSRMVDVEASREGGNVRTGVPGLTGDPTIGGEQTDGIAAGVHRDGD